MDTLTRLTGAPGMKTSPDTASTVGHAADAGTNTKTSARIAFADAMTALSPSQSGLETPHSGAGTERSGTTETETASLLPDTTGQSPLAGSTTIETLEQQAVSGENGTSDHSNNPRTESSSGSLPELPTAMEHLQLVQRADTQAAGQGPQSAAQGSQATLATNASGQLEAKSRHGSAATQGATSGNTLPGTIPARAGLAHEGMPQVKMSQLNMSQKGTSQEASPTAMATQQAMATQKAMSRLVQTETETHHPSTPLRELTSLQLQSTEQRPSPTAQAVSSALALAQRDPSEATNFVPARGDAGIVSSFIEPASSAHVPAQHTGANTHGQGTATMTGTATPPGAATSPAQASLTAPLGSQEWSQQLGRQLLRFSQGSGEQRIEMRLHPAELGPLSVSLKVGDHGAHAQFLSAHAPVRQALEQAIPQLREALAEQGINLGETSVGEQRQGSPDDTSGGFASSDSSLMREGEELAGDEPAIGHQGSVDMQLDGRVDLYA